MGHSGDGFVSSVLIVLQWVTTDGAAAEEAEVGPVAAAVLLSLIPLIAF